MSGCISWHLAPHAGPLDAFASLAGPSGASGGSSSSSIGTSAGAPAPMGIDGSDGSFGAPEERRVGPVTRAAAKQGAHAAGTAAAGAAAGPGVPVAVPLFAYPHGYAPDGAGGVAPAPTESTMPPSAVTYAPPAGGPADLLPLLESDQADLRGARGHATGPFGFPLQPTGGLQVYHPHQTGGGGGGGYQPQPPSGQGEAPTRASGHVNPAASEQTGAKRPAAAARGKRTRLTGVPPPPPPLGMAALAFPSRQAGPARPDTAEGHLKFEPGDNLAARFKIMGKLGEGTFGRVLECWDRQRGKYVAIKVVRAVPKYRDAAMGELRVLATLASRSGDAMAAGAGCDEAAAGEAAWRGGPADRSGGSAGASTSSPAQAQTSPAAPPVSAAARRAAADRCVRLLEWFDVRGHVCMTFPRLGPSLYDVLRRNDYRPLPTDSVRAYLAQICAAAAYVHSTGFVHTDLKPENVLLARDGARAARWPAGSRLARHLPCSDEVVLIDYGSATHASDRHAVTISTRHYRAPEVVLNLGWSHPTDVWSIGCILVELLTGEVLFNTHQDLEHVAMMEALLGPLPHAMAQRAASGPTPARELFAPSGALAWPGGASSRRSLAAVGALRPLARHLAASADESAAPALPEILDLLGNLLCLDPSKRCTAAEALRHPFLASVAMGMGLLER